MSAARRLPLAVYAGAVSWLQKAASRSLLGTLEGLLRNLPKGIGTRVRLDLDAITFFYSQAVGSIRNHAPLIYFYLTSRGPSVITQLFKIQVEILCKLNGNNDKLT